MNLKTAYHGATCDKDTARRALEDEVRSLTQRVQGYAAVTPSQKIQLGINPRDSGKTHSEPVAPDALTVTGYASGVKELFWKRGANGPNTVFVVEALIGGAGEFAQVGGVTAMRFKHDGQKPDVRGVYRVFAQRDGMESLPSNLATVYA